MSAPANFLPLSYYLKQAFSEIKYVFNDDLELYHNYRSATAVE